MDDGHKFDDNLLELYSVSKVLSLGGVLLLHDVWLPSTNKTLEFIDHNLQVLEKVPLGIHGVESVSLCFT